MENVMFEAGTPIQDGLSKSQWCWKQEKQYQLKIKLDQKRYSVEISGFFFVIQILCEINLENFSLQNVQKIYEN